MHDDVVVVVPFWRCGPDAMRCGRGGAAYHASEIAEGRFTTKYRSKIRFGGRRREE